MKESKTWFQQHPPWAKAKVDGSIRFRNRGVPFSCIIIRTFESTKSTQEPGWNYHNHHPSEDVRWKLVYKIAQRDLAQSGLAKLLGIFGHIKLFAALLYAIIENTPVIRLDGSQVLAR